MKKKNIFSRFLVALCLFAICGTSSFTAQNISKFLEIEGIIVDKSNNDRLVFTDLVIKGTNISTVTNIDGEFLLKVPTEHSEGVVVITHLGYETKEIDIASFKGSTKIELTPAVTTLDAVSLVARPSNAKELVLQTLQKKGRLYNNDNTLMTAFYRETIKKRKKNASLSEAVVKIHKQPYTNYRKDNIELVKARKNTNYDRLDTLALKLQGGPFSNIYTDLVKYPEYIFTEEDIDDYEFSFDESTNIDKKLVYVVNFKQNPFIKDPLYYGKLFIDASTLALTNAVYSLNVENRHLASQMFVRKKPRKVDVYPTKATYRVKYRIQNGKWHYAYSNILLSFKVNWKGKLFNSIYTLNSEMAVTDWEITNTKVAKIEKQMLRPSTILTDQASGFSDPEFWGEYNIIEPEKSIENAISKIKRQLKKT
ncbi:carboxypeptidase-like regulatory domain-containing protein [Seonamhaeicola sediminis]|uniref:Carboxypeptidase-like regulatory domain-containing protein n=1 Tax=Seonamhaeicola sediminis TaxID=2528206 RepID=A0A562YI93_9FLAO|nr:carboxypeptidase-like regulatory domain-containing protein [Seonamhaeicola sediminis]TWO34409.1 carboxypeptidase-like regulatory domain-containing protein [Seonamhaeicola sediminis]